MPEFISEIYFSDEYDILLTNGMFNPDRSGMDHPDEEWTDEIVYEQNFHVHNNPLTILQKLFQRHERN